jgi:hypothetical protein
MVSSSTSFATFLNAAWRLLIGQERGPQAERLSVPQILGRLYSLASLPNDGEAGKAPVAPPAVYSACADYLTNTVPLRTMLQTPRGAWPDLSDWKAQIVEKFRGLAAGQVREPGNEIEAAALKYLPVSYLHVYPRQPARSDWRIGINVLPAAVPEAVRLLRPLLDGVPDIDHIKFLGPGLAAKCDSALIYLKKRDATYGALRDRICELARPLPMAPKVARMWNEIAPGIGEAGEPPSDRVLYMSFGQYRCLVTYLTFARMQWVEGPVTFDQFLRRLRDVMPFFGMDFDAPHIQNPLPPEFGMPEGQSLLQTYIALKAAWR